MGTSTISMVIFHSFLYVYQRVHVGSPEGFLGAETYEFHYELDVDRCRSFVCNGKTHQFPQKNPSLPQADWDLETPLVEINQKRFDFACFFMIQLNIQRHCCDDPCIPLHQPFPPGTPSAQSHAEGARGSQLFFRCSR